jgi:hypothetical protein
VREPHRRPGGAELRNSLTTLKIGCCQGVTLSAIFGAMRPFCLVPLVGEGRTKWSRTAVSRGTTRAAFSRGYRYIVHFDGDNFVKHYRMTTPSSPAYRGPIWRRALGNGVIDASGRQAGCRSGKSPVHTVRASSPPQGSRGRFIHRSVGAWSSFFGACHSRQQPSGPPLNGMRVGGYPLFIQLS